MSTLQKHLVRVTKMIREKKKNQQISNEKREFTRDSAEIQSTRDWYEQLYENKMDNLEGMDGCSAQLSALQFISVTQSCPTLCHPMNRSTPRLPVHHQHLEFTQTHTHRVCDAIQPAHPLSSPSPPVPNPSQHQGLFQWVNCSHEGGQVVLEFQLQRQSFQWKLTSFRIDFWIPLQSKVLSRVFSNTIFQKYPFCAARLSSQSYHHIHTWPLGKAIA